MAKKKTARPLRKAMKKLTGLLRERKISQEEFWFRANRIGAEFRRNNTFQMNSF